MLESNDLSNLTFINYHEFLADIMDWERKLPVVDAFVGVRRSGVIPASVLALRRNVRYVDIDQLIADPEGCVEASPLRESNSAVIKRPKPLIGRVMVVDDCCSQNVVTMLRVREALHGRGEDLEILYGAVYRATRTDVLDFSHCEVPQPRMFEWNFFRHYNMHYAMWDIDGAICDDWFGQKEADNPKLYARHLVDAKPFYIPEHPVSAICTNRLPAWSTQTIAWLKKNRVTYGKLIMAPYVSTYERDAKDKPRGKAKGEAYKNSNCTLFVESHSDQAAVIYGISGKPVLALDKMVLLK